jgi:hypothetical protein
MVLCEDGGVDSLKDTFDSFVDDLEDFFLGLGVFVVWGDLLDIVELHVRYHPWFVDGNGIFLLFYVMLLLE